MGTAPPWMGDAGGHHLVRMGSRGLPLAFGAAIAWQAAGFVVPIGFMTALAPPLALGLYCRYRYEAALAAGARTPGSGRPVRFFAAGVLAALAGMTLGFASLFGELGVDGSFPGAPFAQLVALAAPVVLPVACHIEGWRRGVIAGRTASRAVSPRRAAIAIGAVFAPALAILAAGIGRALLA